MARPVPAERSPVPKRLPAFRCSMCGNVHADETTTEAKLSATSPIYRTCLYCGRTHCLRGKLWERA